MSVIIQNSARILGKITKVSANFWLNPTILKRAPNNVCKHIPSVILTRKYSTSLPVNTEGEIEVKDVARKWLEELREAKIPEPEASVQHILSSVLNLPHDSFNNWKETMRIGADQLKKTETMMLCRLSRMPIQYIIKEWDFLNLTLKMMPPVFIPRPETESLVLLASSNIATNTESSCLEIGCGSGAISLALLDRHSNVTCTAIDANPMAIALTKANAEILGLKERLHVFQSTLEPTGFKPSEGLENKNFDLIVSNPPYIPTAEIQTLAPEILLYEDYKALDGGPDGLRVVGLIMNEALKLLKSGGTLIMEVDPRQVEEIQRESSKFTSFSCHEDCFGVKRLVKLKL